jgi:hypothetical protein
MAEIAKEINANQPERRIFIGTNLYSWGSCRFDMTDLSEGEIGCIFPYGYNWVDYLFGEDRIIQNYLEARNYKVEVMTIPLFRQSRGNSAKRGDAIAFMSTEYFVKPPMHTYNSNVGWYASVGYASINARRIYNYVVRTLEEAGKSVDDEPLFSITESSQLLWSTLSRNMKGAIHNWMLTKEPIFRPHHYVTKPNKTGCRLSLADQVTIGILYGLFSFGVKYEAFTGPLHIHPA